MSEGAEVRRVTKGAIPKHRRGNTTWVRSAIGIGVIVGSASATACTGMTSGESHSLVVRTGAKPKAPKRETKTVDLGQDLTKALSAVAQGRYRHAEPALVSLATQTTELGARARIALAEVELMTGRGQDASSRSQPDCRPGRVWAARACSVTAEALRRRGASDVAIGLLEPFAHVAGMRRVQLMLADLLAERGRTTEARVLYRRLVEDFAQARIDDADALELAIAGRAAHRLGAWRDANEFYNRAEMTGVAELTTLVWRGELYLDAHDPLHARAVADEALKFAPEHPSALLLAARVHLTTLEDAAQGEAQVKKVLSIDPNRGDAHAVLAGLALRDLDFNRANDLIDRGLEREPRHLELLSLRAAARFLSDDQDAFEQAVFHVLRQNPNYARVFRVVAEFAESEHRYDDTVPLLRRAVALDPDDSAVRAQLGIQLLRSGQEQEGRKQLSRAFRQDPFDLRVRNTLTLYERKVDKQYSLLNHGPFAIRVPNTYRAALSRFVPKWLDEAKRDLQRRYGRSTHSKIFVELYEDLDSFGVRTSGVPATFLQGVCFGRVIVARLPTDEPTNLGMTLWHELSHVYHLALSKNRVPRWFTEGLAEVETARHRPEWSREQDLAVYEALKHGRLPAVARMNRAFSHASNLDDLAVAYVASTYLVAYLMDTYGQERIGKMLSAWGRQASTEEVVSQVLDVDLDALDSAYRAELQRRLGHFERQYLPRGNAESIAVARTRLTEQPLDPSARAALVHAELQQGRIMEAREVVAQASPAQSQSADLLWARGLVELADQKPESAEPPLRQMISDGHDGYFVRMQLALVARMRGDKDGERIELSSAHQFHSLATEPLFRLMLLAREAGDKRGELASVSKLVRLEETNLTLHRRLVELYLELGQPREAQRAADGLVYVNPLEPEVFRLRARVALANRQPKRAILELQHAARLAPSTGNQDELNRQIARIRSGRGPQEPSRLGDNQLVHPRGQ